MCFNSSRVWKHNTKGRNFLLYPVFPPLPCLSICLKYQMFVVNFNVNVLLYYPYFLFYSRNSLPKLRIILIRKYKVYYLSLNDRSVSWSGLLFYFTIIITLHSQIMKLIYNFLAQIINLILPIYQSLLKIIPKKSSYSIF